MPTRIDWCPGFGADELFIGPAPQNTSHPYPPMSLELACINADWTRRATVNTQKKLVGVLSELVATELALPAAVTLSEVNRGTGAGTAELALPTYECIAEKLTYDTLALIWDVQQLQKCGKYQFSATSKYMVAPFTLVETGQTVVIASVHLPRKRPTGFVGKGTVLDKAHANLTKCVERMYEAYDADKVVIMGDFNTQPTQLAEYHPDYQMMLQAGEVSTEHATCPDNILVWDAHDNDADMFVEKAVLADCEHFEHHPIWTEIN